jgi:diguanylate cyclase (GGDEF)-like protein/hemerythrin-like metal-binding protein
MKQKKAGNTFKKYVTLLAGGISFVILQFIVITMLNSISDAEKIDITQKYLYINDQFEYLMTDNMSLIRGVAAYIQINDTYDDAEMNTLLNILYEDKLANEVRNVGIIQDTTIRWVYPIEGNASAIGIDLSKVEGQADGILKIKNSKKTGVFGPVELVQGGRGIIIRIPILKSETYWGMASIVLNADTAFLFMGDIAKEQNVSLLITHSDNDDEIIYGDKSLLEQNPMRFTSSDNLNFWNTYIMPEDGWFAYQKYLVIFSILSFALSLYIAYRTYKFHSSYGTILESRDSMREISTKDNFTGIWNRRYFDERVLEAITLSERQFYPMSLIYFDLDHFKTINDTYGHAHGDLVLLAVAEKVSNIIRTGDIFARWGGDEFIILLPQTELVGAMAVAEKIRYEVENIKIKDFKGVTASIGVSEHINLEFWESWFLRTDSALYFSKEHGKNRVTTTDQIENQAVHTKIIWLHEWNCGITTIDDAHKAAAFKCNELVKSSFDETHFDETIRKADMLIDEVRNHFDFEIKYLEKINYPDVEGHRALHNELLTMTEYLYSRLLEKQVTTYEMLDFLKNKVVLGHLVYADKNYRDFIK